MSCRDFLAAIAVVAPMVVGASAMAVGLEEAKRR